MWAYARIYLGAAAGMCCLFLTGVAGVIASHGTQPLFSIILTIAVVLFVALGTAASIRRAICRFRERRNKG